VNRAYRDIGRLTGRLEIVQIGWSGGTFEEDQVRIQLDGSYQLPEDVCERVLEPARGEWGHRGFQNNLQCGVRDLQIVRTTDSPIRSGSAHEIRIISHTYWYFEAKATNFEWFGGGSRELLGKYAAGAAHDSHARNMPTPLSVGLSLFCEGGKTLILTRRTMMMGAGGHIAGGQYFNAVGECCAPLDAFGELDGKTRLSIFRTAVRGLLEEMGLDLRQVAGSTPILHTFCWDREILDYSFFGYVVCPLGVEEVRNCWQHAADKSENRDLVSRDVHDREAVARLIREMFSSRKDWSDEACMCTLMSVLHLRRMSVQDVIALSGQQRHAADGASRRS
jgi:hypothetical protein